MTSNISLEARKKRPIVFVGRSPKPKAVTIDTEFDSMDEDYDLDSDEDYKAPLSDGALSRKAETSFKAITSALQNAKRKSYFSLDDKKAIEDAASEAKEMTDKTFQRLKKAKEKLQVSVKRCIVQTNWNGLAHDEIRILKEKIRKLEREQRPAEAPTASALEKKLKDAEEALADERDNSKTLQDQHEKTKQELVDREDRYRICHDELKAKEETVGQMERRIKGSDEAAEHQKTAVQNTAALVERKDNELKAQENELARTKQDLDNAKQLLEEEAGQLREMRTSLAHRDGEVDTLEERLKSKDIEIKQLENIVEQKGTETEVLWDKVFHLQGESKKRLRTD